MKKTLNPKNDVIEAAGGLVWRETPTGRELALIHRERYNDWTLPKGKRETGESWQETALREVLEETGLKVKLGQFAGSLGYSVNGIPKVVLFWHMKLAGPAKFRPNSEVDQMIWLPFEQALEKITYQDEIRLLKAAYPHQNNT